jgi:hypothetical protein
MAPTVDSLLVKDESNVRKWPTQLCFLQAPNAPIPTAFFDPVDRMPILPPDALQLGFITTDGVSQEDSLSSENTAMLQSLEPVRTDLTGIEKTLTVAFGEDNAFVQALWHGTDFADFPTVANAPWLFDDGEIVDYPYYRLGVIMQDGVGAAARFRFEYGYRAKVTAKAGRTMNRSDAETFPFTFGLFKDPLVGKSFTRGQNGPGYVRDASAIATLDGGAIDAITVVNGGSAYDTAPTVVITGDGTGAAATAVVTDGVVTAVTVTTPGTGYTTAAVTFERA